MSTWYDVAKDFQPAFSAIIALCAAALAFRAAWIRVDYDRKLDRRSLINQRVGLCLRLKLHMASLQTEVRTSLVQLRKIVDGDQNSNIEQIDQIRSKIKDAMPIKDAWQNIEIFFYRETTDALYSLSTAIQGVVAAIENSIDDAATTEGVIRPSNIEYLIDRVDSVEKLCETMIGNLDEEYRLLRRVQYDISVSILRPTFPRR